MGFTDWNGTLSPWAGGLAKAVKRDHTRLG
jgi:hypothetical protein